MTDNGYIALWRKIRDHWLWNENRPKTRAEAWIDILCEARHSTEPKKVPIKDKILFCNYGESLKSLDTWAVRWGWNKSKVRRFFGLLEKEGQIVTVNETVTTRLTVCNYKDYDIKNQKSETQSETEVKRIRNASETHSTPNKHVKHVKNVKNEDKPLSPEIPPEILDFTNRFNNLVIEVREDPMEDLPGQAKAVVDVMRKRKHSMSDMEKILNYLIETKDDPVFSWMRQGQLTLKSLGHKTRKDDWKSVCILAQSKQLRFKSNSKEPYGGETRIAGVKL